MSTKAMSMDEMLKRTLKAYLNAQVEAYRESLEGIGENADIGLVQARYEVACITIATALRWIAGKEDRELLPDAWQEPWGKIHTLICEVGDEYLRTKGINPDEL